MTFSSSKAIRLFFILAGIVLIYLPDLAYAAVQIPRPTSTGISQPFQMRTSSRPHRGIDYLTPCGTNLTTAAPISTCTLQQGGGGLIATVDHECGVKEVYMHLLECNVGASSLTTGGEPGLVTSGNSEGCHLHYELHVNGCRVNPENAYGQDLCLEATKRPLFDEAQRIIGEASCSASNLGDQVGGPTQPTQPTDPNTPVRIVLVPVGTINPITGEVNVGEPYYVTVTVDGRIIVEPVMVLDDNELPILPPTTSDVVPTTETDNDITGCATDTWTAMVNQSVLQARRDMLFNKSHILKADSVMAYSCFYQGARQVGQTIGPVFSENKNWVNKQIDIEGKTVTINRELGETSLDGAINNATMSMYEYFLIPNFNHNLLGGTMASGVSSGPEHEAIQAFLDCGTMQQVWQYAKCQIPGDATRYPRFEDLVAGETDPRTRPQNMSCLNTGINQDMISIARGSQVNLSPMGSYSAVLNTPPTSADNGDCYPPVYTGVTVERQRGSGIISRTVRYPDAVCITQGCSYRNSGSDDEGTCELEP